MSDHDRASAAVSVPMSAGTGMSPAMGVAAPVGAVSRKDRARAARTRLEREGGTGLVLTAELPGTVTLQRRGADRTWETVESRSASRTGRTRLDLPADAPSPSTYRVVFAPRNGYIPAWISEDVDG